MQVIVIHGGTSAFQDYEDFIKYLKRKEVDLDRNKSFKDWKGRLSDVLGENFDVVSPRMPNRENARYLEWKIWFEKFIPFMRDDIILIGHSLGGLFIAKYLSENEFPKRICATFLIAAPFSQGGTGELDRDVGEFALPASLERFVKQGGDIFLYHSTDDSVVNVAELEKYKNALPDSRVFLFNDRKHFNAEEFPEIVEAIQTLHNT